MWLVGSYYWQPPRIPNRWSGGRVGVGIRTSGSQTWPCSKGVWRTLNAASRTTWVSWIRPRGVAHTHLDFSAKASMLCHCKMARWALGHQLSPGIPGAAASPFPDLNLAGTPPSWDGMNCVATALRAVLGVGATVLLRAPPRSTHSPQVLLPEDSAWPVTDTQSTPHWVGLSPTWAQCSSHSSGSCITIRISWQARPSLRKVPCLLLFVGQHSALSLVIAQEIFVELTKLFITSYLRGKFQPASCIYVFL